MIELERMTTQYVATEDRISITANVKSGGTARLWLTRRIGDRMVAALVKAVQPRHRDRAYAELIGEMTQQEAEQRLEPQPEVQAATPDHEWLIDKISLQFPTGAVVVRLTGPQGQEAGMALSTEVVRQWLGILRRVYQHGEWPIDQWPESVRREPVAAPRHPVVLH
jgi:hypothetical protein